MEENKIDFIESDLEGSAADIAAEELQENEDAVPVGESGREEREQYEQLIKSRFKDFYAEDTQRLINRRFRKYKIMEARYKLMEESLAEKDAELEARSAKIAELDSLLRSETERVIRETEERILNDIRTKKLRPEENGAVSRKEGSRLDVSKLTKNERSALAKRAANGEKINF